LLAFADEPVVSCFEVVEHLSSFVPLLEWSVELVRERAATFVISVPNDAFWSIQNPHHQASWSEEIFEQLRQLLPGEHTVMRQVALSGSAIAPWDSAAEPQELMVDVGGERSVATHFIAAFGPRHREVQRAALAVQTDMIAQRVWERQRESDAAVAQRAAVVAEQIASDQRAAVQAQDVTIARQRAELRRQTQEFEEWRAYIHELETELGRPLSGGVRENAPSGATWQDPSDHPFSATGNAGNSPGEDSAPPEAEDSAPSTPPEPRG
jgi:hypothetical protein